MTKPAGPYRIICSLGVAACMTAGIQAQTLTHCVPAGATRGRTTRVACYGSGLARTASLWATFPAAVKLAADTRPTDNQAVLEVAVRADAPVGVYGVRVATDSGLSDLRLFVVDDLPIVVASGQNLAADQAQKVDLPGAVAGVMGAEQRHFYSFAAKAGQRVAFEVVGSRYGTDFDPLVLIWASNGKEVGSWDNDEGLAFDCRFEHTFPQAGQYVLEVRDTRYQGGGNWTYHLRMGDFPIGHVAYPAGGKRGQPVSIAFPGRTATDVAPITAQLTSNPMEDMLLINAQGKDASTWVRFVLDGYDQQLELEPNDEPGQANAFLIPRTLNGRLQVKGDVDAFRVAAGKDQSISFHGDTRRLGSPADLYLRILDGSGNQVAVADDTGAEEARLQFKAPADGTYTLLIEDLHGRGGPRFVYRIEAVTAPQSFGIQPMREALVIPQGSAVPMTVQAVRAGYTGPISVIVESPTEKIRCTGDPLTGGAVSTAVTVFAAPDAPAGLHTIRIAGVGKVADQELARGGDLTALLAPKLNNLTLIPPSVTRQVAVLVTPPSFVTLAARLDAPSVGRYVKTPVTVRVASADKFFAGDIQIQVENLPPNVTVAPKPIPKGQRSVQLEFESKANTPLGQFPVFFSGTAGFQGRTVQVFANIMTIEIRPAISLTLADKEIKMVRGGKATVIGKAERHPGYSGPISVVLNGLPKGVAVKPAQILEKQSQVQLEFTAAADAPLTTLNNLTATGTAKIGDQTETVTSPSVNLTVAEK